MRIARMTAAALTIALVAVLLSHQAIWAQQTALNKWGSGKGTNDNALTLGGTVTRFGVSLPGVTSGVATLDGLNPTIVTPSAFTTGLLHCVVTQEGNAPPGDDPVHLTIAATPGMSYFEVYAWQTSAGADPVFGVPSTNSSVTFNWICTGN